MTIQSGVKEKDIGTSSEGRTRRETAPAEMLRGMTNIWKRGRCGTEMDEAHYASRFEMGDLPSWFWQTLQGKLQNTIDSCTVIILKWMDKVSVAIQTLEKRKLAPRYVEPFEILERIGSIAYRLRLPGELSSVHDTFHVSNLEKKYLVDANLHVLLDEIEASDKIFVLLSTQGI
ncbi:hypothetical protein Tco_1103506 [Tanacetum coccineum]